jgi:hypothetical protein
MAMTWGRDETGLVVLPAGGKAKKVKPPKPAKSAEPAKVAKTKPSAKLLAIPEDDIPRYAPPIGLPITAAAPAVWPTATARRPAAVEPRGALVRVLRFLGTTILVIGIAAGGFAAGALTELGTEAEHYVLGLTSSPASASPATPAAPAPAPAQRADPRIATLEAELAAARAQLAARPPAAPAPAVSKDDDDERAKSRRRRERREREREHDKDRDRDSGRRGDRDRDD